MPKALVLGNGNLTVGLDHYGQVREFYFPYVGLENHSSGHCLNKIGVWTDGAFSWLDDGSWDIQVDYAVESLCSAIQAKNTKLSIELSFEDVVYNEHNIFVRQVTVKNHGAEREVRIFFGQQFHLYGTGWGDTAFYDPDERAIIHYKGKRVVIIGGQSEGKPFFDYSIGLFGIEGKEGTWRDAEDGELEQNPIEHGSVDSVIGFRLEMKSGSTGTAHYWLSAATNLNRARHLHHSVSAKTPSHIIETTSDFWHAWVNKSRINFGDLDPVLVSLFKKSLLILRTHVGSNGAIVASTDSEMLKYGRDTYAYVWPRDAAFAAIALDRAGYADTTRSFFTFAHDVISDHGYFFHKYRPDTSLGSSWHPWVKKESGERQLGIQEDETALVIISLWEHYAAHADLEFIEKLYNSLIKKTAVFLMVYRDNRGLPKEGYDLWEEKYGVSTFTVAAVYRALISAANFAQLLGKEYDEQRFAGAADEIREAALTHLYNPDNGFFFKRLMKDGQGGETRDETLDMSAFLGAFRFGLLSLNDARLLRAHEAVADWLCCKTPIGGAVRYEGDRYYRSIDTVPGNPWIITTLWLVQYLIAQAKTLKDLDEPLVWLHWVEKHAARSGILPEQLDPISGVHLSASPLAWSHAEYIITVLDYLKKRTELK